MKSFRHAWVLTAARLLLGGCFVYLGLVKAVDPIGFLKLVREFGIVDSPFALTGIAAVLPWLEVVCGVLMLAGVRARASALLQLGMLMFFTGAVLVRALALYRSGSIPFCSLRFDCGCGTGDVNICLKIVENSAMMLLAAVVAFVGRPQRGHPHQTGGQSIAE